MEKLNDSKEKIIMEYYEDNAFKLRKMVDKVLMELHFQDVNHDDFYSLANEIFVTLINSYDESKIFENFLYTSLYRKFCTEMTRRKRYKRCMRTEIREQMADGSYSVTSVYLTEISLDAPILDEDGMKISDTIASDKDVEKEVFGSEDESAEKVKLFLDSLSKVQRKIVEMKMMNLDVKYIKKKLNLTDRQYSENMNEIVRYEHIRLLHIQNGGNR